MSLLPHDHRRCPDHEDISMFWYSKKQKEPSGQFICTVCKQEQVDPYFIYGEHMPEGDKETIVCMKCAPTSEHVRSGMSVCNQCFPWLKSHHRWVIVWYKRKDYKNKSANF